MKRIFVLLTAVLATVALSGLGTAMADDVSSEAAPTPTSPITWTGNGTTDGFCNNIIDDPSVTPGDQVWLFILTSPSSSSWSLTGEFADAGTFGPIAGVQKGGGAIHFTVTTGLDDQLLSAEATNGKTNSVLTVSHCSAFDEVPETASISVTKVVIPLPDGVTGVTLPTTYTIDVECSDETTATIEFDADGLPLTDTLVSGITPGSTCTVIEDESGLPAGTVVTYNPDGVQTAPGIEVTVADSPIAVEVTNDFTGVQGEVVTKPVTPVAEPVVVSPAFTG